MLAGWLASLGFDLLATMALSRYLADTHHASPQENFDEKLSPLLPPKLKLVCLWDLQTGEFCAWLIRAVFQASSEQIPSEFRANPEQILGKFRSNIPNPAIPQSFCALNVLGWLTTRNTSALGASDWPCNQENQRKGSDG